jgi:hypothetical protein
MHGAKLGTSQVKYIESGAQFLILMDRFQS